MISKNIIKKNAFKGMTFVKVYRIGHPSSQKNEIKKTETEILQEERSEQFDANYIVQVRISVGDVYLARFQNKIGAELQGDHFVVALTNSNVDNPNVIVIPLTSLKEKEINSAHSVCLGVINGFNNNKQSVAMLNQIQCIDKKRLLVFKNIDEILEEDANETSQLDEKAKVIGVLHYRLTSSQLSRLQANLKYYLIRNSRLNKKRKLVDF